MKCYRTVRVGFLKNSLMYETITPDNVMMYAIRHYDNPQCEGEKEFNDDLKDLSISKDSSENIMKQIF